jgi:acetolactate synthase-1/2/3 large subunit
MDTTGLSGAEALLRLLHEMGVEWIFASPGSEWSPVWEYLAKPSGAERQIPRYCSTRHEEVAVAMASGYAKASGKLPAAMIHTTVGALHATMALRAAVHEQIPMVVLAGESIGFSEGPGHDLGQQWLRLLADVGGPARLVEPCVKWSLALNTPAILPAAIQRACQLALAAPQGPVFVSVPMEYLLEPMTTAAPPAAGYALEPAAAPEAIEALAEALVGAGHPVILTEEAGRSVRAVEHLVALAELLGAPVVEGWHPQYLNFPRTHPLYAGVGPSTHVAAYLKEADVAFLVGAVAPWHPPSSAPGPGTKVMVLADNPFRPQLPFWGYRTDLVAAGGLEPSLALLVERVRERLAPGKRADAIERWQRRHQSRRDALRAEAQAAGTRTPLDTRWVIHELNQLLPADAAVVDETITHRLDIHRFLDRLQPGQFFEGCFGGLGTGLGTALGVKAAGPDRTVIALIGDGAFNYNPVLAALGASQEHRMPILIVLFDNSGYLSQKTGVVRHYPEGWAVQSNTFVGTSIAPRPDYPAMARAFGGHGELVEAPGQVRAALERGLQAVASGRVALVAMALQPINNTEAP